MTKKKIAITINKPIRGYLIGSVVKIKVDENGIPLDRYWRDRLKDAPIDGCISIIKKKKSKVE